MADPEPNADVQSDSIRPFKQTRMIALVLFAIALRGGMCYWNFDQFQQDPDAYRAIAQTLAETGVFGITDSEGQGKPTAFRPPLYPYLLSWMMRDGELSRWMVAVLHTLLGTLTVWLTALTGQSLLGRKEIVGKQELVGGQELGRCEDVEYGWPGIAAGILVAIDPILLQQSTLVMTETIATAITMSVIWLWTRVHSVGGSQSLWRWGLIGVLLSLAYLCRPTFLVWAGLLTVAASWAKPSHARSMLENSTPAHKSPWVTRLGRSAAIGACVFTAMACWTIRNQRQVGHPIWATSHGGYTLLLANNPSFYNYLRSGGFGEAWDAQPFLNAYEHRYEGDPNEAEFWNQAWPVTPQPMQGFSEYDDDRRCYFAARATIDREPQMFLWSCVVRVARLWAPMPHHTPDRSWIKIVIVGVFYLMTYLAIAVGLWRLGRKVLHPRWWAILTLAFTLSGVHAIYWSNLRMRAPIIPAMSILAAAAFATRTNREPNGRVGNSEGIVPQPAISQQGLE